MSWIVVIEMLLTDQTLFLHDELFPTRELSGAFRATEARHVEQVVVGSSDPVVFL